MNRACLLHSPFRSIVCVLALQLNLSVDGKPKTESKGEDKKGAAADGKSDGKSDDIPFARECRNRLGLSVFGAQFLGCPLCSGGPSCCALGVDRGCRPHARNQRRCGSLGLIGVCRCGACESIVLFRG